MYVIPDKFLLHVPKVEDRVASNLASFLIVYKEDLHASLRFPLHPLIKDMLNRYDIDRHSLVRIPFGSWLAS